MAYAQCYELPVLPLRFFNVSGPLQPAGHAYAAVVPAFIDAAIADTPLTVYGDGTQSRDFTFADSVSETLSRAIIDRVTSSPVNLAFGTRTTLVEVIDFLEGVGGAAARAAGLNSMVAWWRQQAGAVPMSVDKTNGSGPWGGCAVDCFVSP